MPSSGTSSRMTSGSSPPTNGFLGSPYVRPEPPHRHSAARDGMSRRSTRSELPRRCAQPEPGPRASGARRTRTWQAVVERHHTFTPATSAPTTSGGLALVTARSALAARRRRLPHSGPAGRRDRRHASRARLEDERDPLVERAPAELEGRQRRARPRARATGRRSTGNGMCSRRANSICCSSGCAERPATRAPSSVSSHAWSRNAHDCGVHPRAPGIASQPSGVGRPGMPVAGYT